MVIANRALGHRPATQSSRASERPKTEPKALQTPINYQALVGRQTDFDVTIERCVASDRSLACAILVRHKALSAGVVKVCLPP